jgi:nucleotide-binding universal stress UspA family protein
MKHMESPGPIIVGVDGSRAAINAAVWAIDEAISRDVPLRIVHVTHIRQASIAPKVQFSLDKEYAEAAVRQAHAAIEATGRPVKVETVVLRGDVDEALAEESRAASMMCVGSVGVGRISRVLFGSTAMSLATRAHCPVAIIRTNSDAPAPSPGRIAVVVNDEPGNDAVLQAAMNEARVRGEAIVVLGTWQRDLGQIPYDELDRRVGGWMNRHPDVDVHPVVSRAGMASFLETTDTRISLAVIGSPDVDRIPSLIGPRSQPILPHAECSILVVRSSSDDCVDGSSESDAAVHRAECVPTLVARLP